MVQMSITDDELAELKAGLRASRYSVGRKTVLALIVRLEAAEKAMRASMSNDPKVWDEAWIAWHKAAGCELCL